MFPVSESINGMDIINSFQNPKINFLVCRLKAIVIGRKKQLHSQTKSYNRSKNVSLVECQKSLPHSKILNNAEVVFPIIFPAKSPIQYLEKPDA
jgi:hypothetical protein